MTTNDQAGSTAIPGRQRSVQGSSPVDLATDPPQLPVDTPPPSRSADGPGTAPYRGRYSVERVALLGMLAAFVVLIGWQLGAALIGLKTFSGVDVLTAFAPWDDRWSTETWQSPWVGDTIDSILPSYAEAHRRIWSGDIPWWSSLSASGSPLLSSTNLPSLTPSAIWMVLAPTSWAVGFTKLIQLIMAFGGMTLWVRRIGTSWAAGALAGLLYCSSGFFVGWSGWVPQAGVAATVPVLFWVIERFLALRTARSAVLLSVVVAWLLLGGFPAVAGHALYMGGAYFLVRCIAERRRLGGRGVMLTVASGAAAVALGVALSAIQLLPFVRSLSSINTDYRANQFNGQQPIRSFMSVLFPRIFNTDGGIQQFYGANTNPIEAYAYLGMGAVALAVLAILAGRRHGVFRGVVPVLLVSGALAAALVWRHGFWTNWLADFPVFANNNSSRLRDIVALTGSALAGIGFNLVFARNLPRAVQRRLVIGAWFILAVAATATVLAWRRYSEAVDNLTFLVDAGLGLLTVTLVATAFTVAHVRTDRPAADRASDAQPASSPSGCRRLTLLSVTVLGLAALTGTAAVLSTEYFWPTSDVSDFYPNGAGVQAAVAATGDNRALALGGTLLGSSGTANGIRTITGHTFPSETWKDYLLALDPKAFTPPGRTPTNPRVELSTSDDSLNNPLLDRMAVTTVLATPGQAVPGPLLTLQGLPTAARSAPGSTPVTVGASEVPAGTMEPQAVRGFVVNVTEPVGNGRNGIRIAITVRDSTGTVIGSGGSIRQRWEPGWTQIAVAGKSFDNARGPLAVSVSVDARDVPGQTLTLSGVSGTVEALVIGTQGDGLELYFADSQVQVWQRPSALPRIRWATGSTVIEDPVARLAALADPATSPSMVVLSAPGPPPAGGQAQLSLQDDSGDRVIVDVQADTAGYLVLADSLQSGWTAEVNGEPAPLVAADHAFGAVYVPAGANVVTFQFVGQGLRTGALVSAASVLIVVLVLVAPSVLCRVRRRRSTADAVRAPAPVEF